MRRAGAIALAALLLFPSALAAATPTAFFTLSPASVGAGAPTRADASDSRPSDEATRIVEYAWDWNATGEFLPGDRIQTRAFNASGLHVVALRVTDDAGLVGFVNQTLLVKGSLPEADLFPVFDTTDEGLRATVNATFSFPSVGATRIVTYEWDWGEGEGFFVGNVSETHLYAKPGTYTIVLRVTDDAGRTDTEAEPVVFRSTFGSRMLIVAGDWESFARGARLTLVLAVGATVLGFLLAVALAVARVSRFRLMRWPAAVYIEFIRGTPLLVQILVAWLVLPQLGLHLTPLYAGALALVVNTSAYQAEAIRGGIQGIPTGQMEAAISLGLTYPQAMRRVVLPQAFRLTLPPLGNEFIILLKDTSLVSVIGVVELTKIATIFSAQTFLVLEAWLGVALVYFVMTYTLSVGLRRLERKLAIPGLGLQGAAS